MNNKICIVTGGSSGVGKATAKGLAELGYTVIMVSRNKEKALKVLNNIIHATGNKNIHWMYADLSDQHSIRNFVEDFKQKYDKLNVLSNNAGIIQLKREETVDHIEKTLAVDYLSHFLLSNLLVDVLKNSAPSRIITVAGGKRLIQYAKLNIDDLQFKHNYNGFKAAIQAALARVLFTVELAKRLKGTGVTCNAFQPGFVKSDLGNNLPFALRGLITILQPFLSSECKTSVYLASSDKVAAVSGKFFKNKKAMEFNYGPGISERLWNISGELTGLKHTTKTKH